MKTAASARERDDHNRALVPATREVVIQAYQPREEPAHALRDLPSQFRSTSMDCHKELSQFQVFLNASTQTFRRASTETYSSWRPGVAEVLVVQVEMQTI